MKDFWGYFWDAMFALVGFIMAMGLVVVFLALLWYALGITGMVTYVCNFCNLRLV